MRELPDDASRVLTGDHRAIQPAPVPVGDRISRKGDAPSDQSAEMDRRVEIAETDARRPPTLDASFGHPGNHFHDPTACDAARSRKSFAHGADTFRFQWLHSACQDVGWNQLRT